MQEWFFSGWDPPYCHKGLNHFNLQTTIVFQQSLFFTKKIDIKIYKIFILLLKKYFGGLVVLPFNPLRPKG